MIIILANDWPEDYLLVNSRYTYELCAIKYNKYLWHISIYYLSIS